VVRAWPTSASRTPGARPARSSKSIRRATAGAHGRPTDPVAAQGTFDGVQDLAEAYVGETLPNAPRLWHSPERRANRFLLGERTFDGQGPRNAR